MSFDPVSAALDIGGKIIDRVWPDPAQKDAAKLELLKMYQSGALAQLAAETELSKSAADIIKAEANGGWLASSWRPITMLVFVGLIVARWFGWSAPNLQQAEYLKLWDIVQLGLGGYVIGRSFEKVVPTVADALKK
jgi:Holin of 3TMs, for gene-transfer release